MITAYEFVKIKKFILFQQFIKQIEIDCSFFFSLFLTILTLYIKG